MEGLRTYKIRCFNRVYEITVYEGITKKTIQKVEYWDAKQVLKV